MKRTANESETLTVGGNFKLELPLELDVKPIYEFKVAKNYTLRAWQKTRTVELKDGGGTREETYFLIDVRHTNGKPTHERYGRRGDEAHDLVDLRLIAEDYAFDLRPKARTRTKVEQDEDDE